MSRQLASIGERFTAQFIDGLVALGAAVACFFAARSLGLPLDLAFVGFGAYLLFCDGLPGGQSLGKRFTRSSVVHIKTEQPCRYWQSFVRNLCLMILGVVDCAFIAGQQRRRLGDFLAQTKVVRLPSPTAA